MIHRPISYEIAAKYVDMPSATLTLASVAAALEELFLLTHPALARAEEEGVGGADTAERAATRHILAVADDLFSVFTEGSADPDRVDFTELVTALGPLCGGDPAEKAAAVSCALGCQPLHVSILIGI
jgi:hypothetical protein